MTTQVNSREAAELIESQTGRACTRQNLEKLCIRGALHGSRCVLQLKPMRFDADLVVQEYLARVAPIQAEAQQPRAKRPAAVAVNRQEQPAAIPRQLPADSPEDLPEYTISRARSEYEKANLLELDRRTKEAQLLRREDVTAAWTKAVNLTRSKLLGVPGRVKARIPHLETEEVEVITMLVREALEELAGGEVAA